MICNIFSSYICRLVSRTSPSIQDGFCLWQCKNVANSSNLAPTTPRDARDICIYVFVCMSVLHLCILLREYLQQCVCMYVSPVGSTSWQRLEYVAIRIKHNCNSCYGVCIYLAYVFYVYICIYTFCYIYVLRLTISYTAAHYPMDTSSSIPHRFDVEIRRGKFAEITSILKGEFTWKLWHWFNVDISMWIRLSKSTKYRWVLHVDFSMSFRRQIDVTSVLAVSILSFSNIFCSGNLF